MAGGLGRGWPAGGNSLGMPAGSMLTLYHPSGAPSRPFVIREYDPSASIHPIALSFELFPLPLSGANMTIPLVIGFLFKVTLPDTGKHGAGGVPWHPATPRTATTR